MKHFFRSQLEPADVLIAADRFFPAIGFATTATAARARSFSGPLGALKLGVKSEAGHYTMIDVETDQMGESRMDRNVKKFFVALHRMDDPRHALEAAY
jgi:hypothetical protein